MTHLDYPFDQLFSLPTKSMVGGGIFVCGCHDVTTQVGSEFGPGLGLDHTVEER